MTKQTHAMRIMIVDAEKKSRRFLKTALRAEGYHVFEASDGQSALESCLSIRPDLIILDLNLPDIDGTEVILDIRKRIQLPIVVLTARTEERFKIKALDAGADDYVAKPFSVTELLARLRAVIRRWIPQDKDHVFKIGDLSVDITKRKVQFAGNDVRLTPTEYEVLKVLIFNSGKVVTQQQFFREVWNRSQEVKGADHLLRVTVSKLRNKIEPDANRPTYIFTEPAVGYRLQFKSSLF